MAKSVFTQFNANSPTSGGNFPSHAYNIYVASTSLRKDEKEINSSKSVKNTDNFSISLKKNTGKPTIFSQQHTREFEKMFHNLQIDRFEYSNIAINC